MPKNLKGSSSGSQCHVLYWKNDSRCIQSLQAGFPTAPSSKDLDSSCQDLTFLKYTWKRQDKREVQEAESLKKIVGQCKLMQTESAEASAYHGRICWYCRSRKLSKARSRHRPSKNWVLPSLNLLNPNSWNSQNSWRNLFPGPAPSPSLLSSCVCSGGLSRTHAPWPKCKWKIHCNMKKYVSFDWISMLLWWESGPPVIRCLRENSWCCMVLKALKPFFVNINAMHYKDQSAQVAKSHNTNKTGKKI